LDFHVQSVILHSLARHAKKHKKSNNVQQPIQYSQVEIAPNISVHNMQPSTTIQDAAKNIQDLSSSK